VWRVNSHDPCRSKNDAYILRSLQARDFRETERRLSSLWSFADMVSWLPPIYIIAVPRCLASKRLTLGTAPQRQFRFTCAKVHFKRTEERANEKPRLHHQDRG
jgi:hypothetical protein